MKIHKVRAFNFDDFKATPNLATHIIVGYSEMLANAEMFGGKDSDSFKIKYKNFEKFAKKALGHLTIR